MNTGLEQTIVERLHVLDDAKLVEVLDFVEFIAQRHKDEVRNTIFDVKPSPLRHPHPDIAGKLVINGNIFDSAASSDSANTQFPYAGKLILTP